MKKIISFILINIFFFLFGIGVVLAVTIENPLTATSFEALIDSITGFLFKIAIGLAPLMILIGAFYIMTAGGDTNRVTTGKNIILYTLIGFVIILLANALVDVVKQLLEG